MFVSRGWFVVRLWHSRWRRRLCPRRESASKERIKKRHRELLIRNHPDKGGSTFVATKINEAKDKLLGG